MFFRVCWGFYVVSKEIFVGFLVFFFIFFVLPRVFLGGLIWKGLSFLWAFTVGLLLGLLLGLFFRWFLLGAFFFGFSLGFSLGYSYGVSSLGSSLEFSWCLVKGLLRSC